MENEILDHLLKEYPKEGCGIIINKSGRLKWLPCDNIAKDPYKDFKISPSIYAKASIMGDPYQVVHSHPDCPPEPSKSDIVSSDYLSIPFRIISIPSMEEFIYTPEKEKSPLLNRKYSFGASDCYSLIVDYYKEELGITLPTAVYEDDFWEKGIDYFGELPEKYGFEEVAISNIKPYDIITFSVASDIENHCGMYIGNDLFIHHAVNRLSCRESIYSLWGKYITKVYRCKEFI